MASRHPAQARAPSGLNLTREALRSVAEVSAGEEAGHTCRGRLLPLAKEEEEHAGEAADVRKPQRGQK